MFETQQIRREEKQRCLDVGQEWLGSAKIIYFIDSLLSVKIKH